MTRRIGLLILLLAKTALAQPPSIETITSWDLSSPLSVSGDGNTILGGSWTYPGHGPGPIESWSWTWRRGSGTTYNPGYSAISADGHVAAAISESASGWELVRWVNDVREVLWRPLNSARTTRTAVTAVSGDGSVIAGLRYTQSTSGVAWRWTAETGIRLLPIAADSNVVMSRDGRVVISDDWDQPVFYRWSEMTGPEVISVPGGAIYNQHRVTGCSADGSVVVGHRGTSPRGFRWREGAGFEFFDGQPECVSADGRSMGGWANFSFLNTRAVVWTPTGNRVWVHEALQGAGVAMTTMPYSCDAISDDGRVLTGTSDFGIPKFLKTYTARMPRGFACYANCDGSMTSQVLTAIDIQCFINAAASGSSYANCDGSTVPPVISANDYLCFMNAFFAGCP